MSITAPDASLEPVFTEWAKTHSLDDAIERFGTVVDATLLNCWADDIRRHGMRGQLVAEAIDLWSDTPRNATTNEYLRGMVELIVRSTGGSHDTDGPNIEAHIVDGCIL